MMPLMTNLEKNDRQNVSRQDDEWVMIGRMSHGEEPRSHHMYRLIKMVAVRSTMKNRLSRSYYDSVLSLF
ncbi:hypothetical protein Tco_0538771 [Tanacetum coccineum]